MKFKCGRCCFLEYRSDAIDKHFIRTKPTFDSPDVKQTSLIVEVGGGLRRNVKKM